MRYVAAMIVLIPAALNVCSARAAVGPPDAPYFSRSDEKILAAIPADAAGVYYCQPTNPRTSFSKGLAGILTAASTLGMFGQDQQVLADVVSVILELSKHPHAIVLLDAASKRRGEGSFRLDHFSAAMIVDVPVNHGTLLTLLKQTIDHYCTSENAKIVSIGQGANRRQRLIIKDMPKWCYWEWGWTGELFVLAVGPGAYDRIAEDKNANQTRRLKDRRIITAANLWDGDLHHRLWMLHLNTVILKQKLRPVLGRYFDQAVAALQLENIDEVIFSAGYRQRAFITKLYLDRPDGIYRRPLTQAFAPDDPLAKLVPPQARSYAFGMGHIAATVGWASSSYLSTHNPRRREKILHNYRRVMQKFGISDTDRQLFAHLGPEIIVHDWPLHPFNWPTSKTVLVRHDGSDELERNLPKVLAAWKELLAMAGRPKPGGNQGNPKSNWTKGLFDISIDRTADGIWYAHTGPVVLVAAGRSDGWLVFSWSVQAVRENLAHLARRQVAKTAPAGKLIPPTRPATTSQGSPHRLGE